MFERKLIGFSKNAHKALLRDYFNSQDHKNYKSITPIATYFGVSGKDAYEYLLDEYNQEVERRKQNKKLQIRNALNFLSSIGNAVTYHPVKVKSKPRLDINKLQGFVCNWYRKNLNGNNSHFSIKLQSQLAPDVKNTFRFNHISHFNNWIAKVVDQSYILTAESWGNVEIPDNDEFYDLFKNVLVDNIKFVAGGCNKHCAGDKNFKSAFYEFKLFNPQSMNNNCFFKCVEHLLGNKININNLRKQFKIETKKEVCINDAYLILQHLGMNVLIIDENYNEELDENQKYLLILKNHYYVIQSWTEIIRKEKSTKRGLMTFDFETRKTEDFHLIKASNKKSFILKDSLCCVYYRPYKATSILEKTIITNEKTSARQFLDFLNQESKENRSYNVIAHNGGKFDFYFVISVMTDQEIKDAEIQMRGTTVISLNYRGNLFKDSCCFLTDTLQNLSKSFKIDHGKIIEFDLHNEKISSSQLCFYKPYINFQQFLNLQTEDPEYWKLYEKYCMYDCIALFEIWEKFTLCINSLIEKISPFLLKKCPLMSSTTIGSHSKKILVEINKYEGNINFNRQNIQKFVGLTKELVDREGKEISDNQRWHIDHNTPLGKTLQKTHMKMEERWDMEKYNFLCKFKRGGISTCNQAGKHMSGITGVDIASQYPASLIYSFIPTGESRWINNYDESVYGFYHLKDLVFESNYALKPVASLNLNNTLNWASNSMNELYIDSYMLKYIKDEFGLKSFNVVRGLVSNQHILSSKVFGKYIDTFYKEKQHQDELKDSNEPEISKEYNPALRTTIKLYLNSLTGKLVENPNVHFSLAPTPMPEEGKETIKPTQSLNGVGMTKTFHEDKVNDWISCGIMVYSYSKRLLFEYIKCLPDKSNDVIHIETDGIYFSTRHLDAFTENLNKYEGDYPCKFGENLGNLNIEKTTHEGQVAHFLGKKFYCISMPDGKNIMRIKGIPQSTIDDYGNKIQLVDKELYDDIYNGKTSQKEFQTLRKALFTQKTHISSHTIKRTIRPNQTYAFYK